MKRLFKILDHHLSSYLNLFDRHIQVRLRSVRRGSSRLWVSSLVLKTSLRHFGLWGSMNYDVTKVLTNQLCEKYFASGANVKMSPTNYFVWFAEFGPNCFSKDLLSKFFCHKSLDHSLWAWWARLGVCVMGYLGLFYNLDCIYGLDIQRAILVHRTVVRPS